MVSVFQTKNTVIDQMDVLLIVLLNALMEVAHPMLNSVLLLQNVIKYYALMAPAVKVYKLVLTNLDVILNHPSDVRQESALILM